MSMKGDFCFKYLPKDEFERIVLKVQQSRQEKEDEMRWEQYMAQINKTSESNENKNFDSSSSSSSSSSAEEAPVINKPKPSLKVSKTETLVAPSKKKSVSSIEQHVKTNESIVKVQSGIQSLLASIGAQIVSMQHMDSEEEEDDEPMSAKAVKLKGVRFAEFNARFRRNYIYPLQVEVHKCSDLVNSKQCSSNQQAAPSNVSHQMSLRSLERAHTRAFQALQIFHRQCQALKDLLTNPVLLEDLLAQLSNLSQLSSSLGLPNEVADNQRRDLSQQVAQHTLQADLARLGIATARKKQPPASTATSKSKVNSKKMATKPVRPAQRGQLLRRSGEKAKPRARSQTWSKGKQQLPVQVKSEAAPEKVLVVTSQSSSEEVAPMKIAAAEVCHPVNVRVLMMQHQPVTSEKAELQDMGTQTSMLQSRGVGPDEPSVVTTQQVESSVSPILPKVPSDSFTSKLQRAVLSELAGETDHLGPLIDQLLREEFL